MHNRAPAFLTNLLSLCAFSTLLPAQTAGSLSGLATHSFTGEPVPGVQIHLHRVSADRSSDRQSTSDDQGRYHIAELTPGRYEFTTTKTGFVSQRQIIQVVSSSTKVDTRLIPHAQVSGRVTLGPERPAPGVPVEIRKRGGRPRLTAITAADGSYTFNALEPGRYLLSAGGRSAALRKLSGYTPAQSSALDNKPTTWAPVFFPDGPSPAEAQPLVVTGGVSLNGYNLQLRQVPAHRIHGVVVDDRGEPAGGAALELFSSDRWFGSEYETVARPDGSFELDGVREGDWTLRASAVRGTHALKGNLQFAVSKMDSPALRLELTPPFALDGFVDRDEPRDKEGKRLVSGIYLSAQDGGEDLGPKFHQQNGQFRFDAVYPGRYRIQPVGFLPGWYLDAVYVGSHEVLKGIVDLRPENPPIRIVYLPKAGRARGQVDKGAAAHVYMLPAEEELWDSQFIRYAQADSAGRFEVGSLRPGEYIAFAFAERQETDELSDPALVRPLLIQGTRVSIRRGEVAELNVKLIPGGL
ncbi:MAG: carboxypeptidase regulatory-like domain-containing protein [Acidobacteria bacterium]|nr:carboxypeptidase regulatory-like domain-containing protein [Acidobacteriota bacterium]